MEGSSSLECAEEIFDSERLQKFSNGILRTGVENDLVFGYDLSERDRKLVEKRRKQSENQG